MSGVRVPPPLLKRICFFVVVSALAAGCSGGAHAKKPLITTERVKSVGFYGVWERPRGTQHHTAILLFGGSEGGLGLGALTDALVSHGYPVLDIAYFRAPGLPQTLQRIRLEYFQHALRWLAKQPQVDSKRIVTFGISRGGELSLILASTFPNLVHGAVDYVGSWFVDNGLPPGPPAWTYQGKPLFGWPVSGVIPVWKINGPVFAAGGGDDTLAQSGLSVQTLAKEMREHKRTDLTALVYPRAGHLLGLVLPVAFSDYANGNRYGFIPVWFAGQLVNLGGSAKADLAARRDSWPKLLKFLAGVTPR